MKLDGSNGVVQVFSNVCDRCADAVSLETTAHLTPRTADVADHVASLLWRFFPVPSAHSIPQDVFCALCVFHIGCVVIAAVILDGLFVRRFAYLHHS